MGIETCLYRRTWGENCIWLSDWRVCCNPLMWTVCLTLVFPPLCPFSSFLSFCLLYSVTFLSPPLLLLPPCVACLSSVAQTWKIYRTISIDTCLLQRTNGLAISPQHLWAAWQPLRPQALCAARQGSSPSQASRSASCPRRAEKRPSRGWRYTDKHFPNKRRVKGLSE